METNRQDKLHSCAQKTNRPRLHLPIRKTLGKSAAGTGSVGGLMGAFQPGDDVGIQRAEFRIPVMTSDDMAPVWELLIYRLDGRLSVIFVTTFFSDSEAIEKAEELARYGYRVEVWRNGIEVGRAAKSSEGCANRVVSLKIDRKQMQHGARMPTKQER